MSRGNVAVLGILFASVWVNPAAGQSLRLLVVHQPRGVERLLQQFEQQTGIAVQVTSSPREVEIIQEVEKLRQEHGMDAIWSDDVLDMMGLAEHNLLQAYKSPNRERINDQFYDPEARWIGFSGRLRIWVINRERISIDHQGLLTRFIGDDLSRFAMADPLHGHSLTYLSLLWKHDGEQAFQDWYPSLKGRGARFVQDDAAVLQLVRSGECDFGWTNSDEFLAARAEGALLDVTPIRIESETVCIPNTVAIIAGTQRTQAAQKLVDFLTSEATERQLAAAPYHQIPLGELDDKTLPDDVRKLMKWSADALDLRRGYQSREPCLHWILKNTESLQADLD